MIPARLARAVIESPGTEKSGPEWRGAEFEHQSLSSKLNVKPPSRKDAGLAQGQCVYLKVRNFLDFEILKEIGIELARGELNVLEEAWPIPQQPILPRCRCVGVAPSFNGGILDCLRYCQQVGHMLVAMGRYTLYPPSPRLWNALHWSSNEE